MMRRQKGIADLWLLLIVLAAVATAAWFAYDTVDDRAFKRGLLEGRAEVQREFDGYKGAVERAAAEERARQQKRKEKIDAEVRRLKRDRDAALERLRNERAKRSVVPEPTPETGDTGRITFDRAELDRALQEFLGEIEELIGEGQEAVDALNAMRGGPTP